MNKFETGLRKATKKVATIVHPTLTISNEAVKALNQILSGFNDRLIEECRNNFKPNKGDGVMREEAAQKAVEELMRGRLRQLAIANAHKTLAQHSSGVLAYTPRALRPKKKQKTVNEEFLKCVGPLSKLVDPSVKIGKDAKDAIAQFVFQMGKALIGKAQTLALERGELAAEEIIMAVDFYMKPVMAKHAIAEGTKNCVLFLSNSHYYSQEEFAVKCRIKH